MKTAQGGASEMVRLCRITINNLANEQGDAASQLAKAFLPPGAFTLFSAVASQSGGINGFLSNLKDKDLQGVLDEVKKVGGDDIKRITDKVEKKLKDANGKVQNIDWKSLAQELKKELPEDKQHMVDVFIGRIPDKEDFEKMIAKAKETGAEQFKAAEKAASKVLEQVEKARKEGKGQANAFLAGLKSGKSTVSIPAQAYAQPLQVTSTSSSTSSRRPPRRPVCQQTLSNHGSSQKPMRSRLTLSKS